MFLYLKDFQTKVNVNVNVDFGNAGDKQTNHFPPPTELRTWGTTHRTSNGNHNPLPDPPESPTHPGPGAGTKQTDKRRVTREY